MPTPLNAREEAILAHVDRSFEQQTAFLADLVRFASQRGHEATQQDYVFAAFRERGLAMDRWRLDETDMTGHPGYSPVVDTHYDNAWNVVGSFRPTTETGRSLILNAHVDVVPTGPADAWQYAPYDPVIRDGWMNGRGAADMKAGLAANIFAFDALRGAGFDPAATVHLQSVVEEESTGNGTLSTSVRGYRADAVICPEPSDERLTRANVGVLWFSVRVRGRPAHTSEMQSGTNAIDGAYRVIAALREVEAAANAEKHHHPLFAAFANPLNLNVGRIEGGDWNSSVPAECTVHFRFAMFPGTPAATVRKTIEERIAALGRSDPAFRNNPPEVRWTGFNCEGFVLEAGTDAERALAAAHTAVHGAALKDRVTPAYLDARVTMLYDKIPTLVYGPTGRNIHSIDEAVDLESVRRVTKTIALFMARWCGLTPRP